MGETIKEQTKLHGENHGDYICELMNLSIFTQSCNLCHKEDHTMTFNTRPFFCIVQCHVTVNPQSQLIIDYQ